MVSALLDGVAERRHRVLARLEQLVCIETPTGHRAGLDDAQTLVASWITPIVGYEPTVEVVDGVRHLLWRGGESARLLLLGHLDTVFPLGTLAERPFALRDERLTGPGVFDMKAGVVIMAEALAGVADPGDVAILLTSDEETGSITSRGLVEREARRARRVLVLEPSLDGAVKIARRGGSMYRVDVRGRAAHAGLEPDAGRSALVELAHQVLAMPGLADQAQGTTVSPTVAQAGTATNVIPERAVLDVDARAWTMAELERVDGAMRALPARTDDVVVTASGGINRPPMEESASAELLASARRVAAHLGQGALDAVSAGGASDGNFAAAAGAKTLDGLGPDGGGAHAVDEWVSVPSLLGRIDLVAGLIDEVRSA